MPAQEAEAPARLPAVAARRGHGGPLATTSPHVDEARQRRAGVPAPEPPGRLPDLRPGRRVHAPGLLARAPAARRSACATSPCTSRRASSSGRPSSTTPSAASCARAASASSAEVAKDPVLDMRERGNLNEIIVSPGPPARRRLHAHDRARVPGRRAHDSSDFRFKARVWFLRSARDGLPGLRDGLQRATSTTTRATTRPYRYRPRENEEVNKYWMCDEGMLSYKRAIEGRLAHARSSAARTRRIEDALAAAKEQLKGHGNDPSRVAIVLSAQHSNEDNFALATLAKTLPRRGRLLRLRPPARPRRRHPHERGQEPQHPRRDADRLDHAAAPDRRAARRHRRRRVRLRRSRSAPSSRSTRRRRARRSRKLKGVVTIAAHDGPLAKAAHIALPACAWAEVDGTYVNRQGLAAEERARAPPARRRPPRLGARRAPRPRPRLRAWTGRSSPTCTARWRPRPSRAPSRAIARRRRQARRHRLAGETSRRSWHERRRAPRHRREDRRHGGVLPQHGGRRHLGRPPAERHGAGPRRARTARSSTCRATWCACIVLLPPTLLGALRRCRRSPAVAACAQSRPYYALRCRTRFEVLTHHHPARDPRRLAEPRHPHRHRAPQRRPLNALRGARSPTSTRARVFYAGVGAARARLRRHERSSRRPRGQRGAAPRSVAPRRRPLRRPASTPPRASPTAPSRSASPASLHSVADVHQAASSRRTSSRRTPTASSTRLAPMIALFPAFVTMAVLPFGRTSASGGDPRQAARVRRPRPRRAGDAATHAAPAPATPSASRSPTSTSASSTCSRWPAPASSARRSPAGRATTSSRSSAASARRARWSATRSRWGSASSASSSIYGGVRLERDGRVAGRERVGDLRPALRVLPLPRRARRRDQAHPLRPARGRERDRRRLLRRVLGDEVRHVLHGRVHRALRLERAARHALLRRLPAARSSTATASRSPSATRRSSSTR